MKLYALIALLYISGLDQYTETDVVIKFVPPGLTTDLLENEYQKYLLLGADGKFNMFIKLNTNKQKITFYQIIFPLLKSFIFRI